MQQLTGPTYLDPRCGCHMKWFITVLLWAPLFGQTDELDAVKAIKALRSITTSVSDVPYVAFQDRLLDAKVKADQAENLDPKLKLALRYYDVSSAAWSAGPRNDVLRFVQIGAMVATNEVQQCSPVARMTAAEDSKHKKKPQAADVRNLTLGFTLSRAPSLLWSCAADLITQFDAEKAKQ